MNGERRTDFSEIAELDLPQGLTLCPGPEGVSSVFLSGGIVNHNLKVYLSPGATPAVLSIYSSGGKERVAREIFTRSLLGEKIDVPVQRIIGSSQGYMRDGKEYGLLIKEFKEGETLYRVLQNMASAPNQLGSSEVTSLLYDLGKNLHSLGSVRLPKFGKIEGRGIVGPSENCGWKDYYFYRLNKRVEVLENLDPNKRVCGYTVGDILELTPKLLTYAESHSDVLNTIMEPRLVHNDFHFLNILAAKDNGHWQISGILDLESATSGDPEFDLVSMESQLNLAPEYKDFFMSRVDYFKAGYENPISDQYQEKRNLYHLTWSLSYFEAVMQMDTNLHPIDRQIEEYMEGHYKVLKGLATGQKLREIGVPSLF